MNQHRTVEKVFGDRISCYLFPAVLVEPTLEKIHISVTSIRRKLPPMTNILKFSLARFAIIN